MKYAVVDADNNISWSEKTEKGEVFSSLKAAQKRASEIADCEPGKTVGIYQLVSEAIAEVSPVEIRNVE